MRKQEIVNEIGQIQGKLTQAEHDLRQWEQKAEKARRDYTSGLVGLVLGLIGLLIWWPLGFLGVAGLLAVLGSMVRKNEASEKIDALVAQTANCKVVLARMQAQLWV